ncbi:CHAT domain-containing protein [Nocardioides panacisoli]|uniref:CHAT domain-containing protein n=1 Tax=Nocardioides panacisoli TaxID=627624 RepID=A0ABP7IPW6_9ACTN
MTTLGNPASTAGTEVDRLIESAAAYSRRDAERSADLLDRAETALSGRRDFRRTALLSEIRGDLAVRRGQLGDAASAFRLARRNWLAVAKRLEAIRATIGSTEVQLLLGEFEEAEAAVLRTQGELAQEPHEDGRVTRLNADSQRQLADARARMGHIPTANRHYNTAENLYAALGDYDGIAQVHLGRGLAALDAGLAHNAVLELDRARAMFLAAGADRPMPVLLVLMAEALSSAGQVGRALELLDCLQPDLDSLWDTGAHRVARSHALLRAGFTAEAHAEARAAQEDFTEIGAVEHYARATLACGRASLQWGRANAAAGELAVAESLFEECGSNLMRARTWLAQAELAMSVDDIDGARALCTRVLAEELDDTVPYVGVQARIMAARVENPEAASLLLDGAAELASRTGLPELRISVRVARAQLQRRLGERDEAIDSLRGAIAAGRAWQGDLGERGAGTCCLSEGTMDLIAMLLERDDHAGRVEAWRRARAVKCDTVVPFAERTRGSVPSPDDEARHRRLDQLITETIRATSSAGIVTEETLPSVPWGSMIEYFVMGDDVVAFVLRDGQVDARVLRGVAPESQRLVRSWQQECRLMAAGSADDWTTSSPSLDGLCEMLVAPIANLLADLDEELQIIGHRHLNAIPFDALLDEVGPWYSQLDGGLPLPSAPRPAADPPTDLAMLVLAVPDENAPLITAEAEMIFRTLPSAEIVLGADAGREALARRQGAADLVHFACHGVFRQDSPLSSALRLGDGWLLASDIVTERLGLEGSVVVLSACGSGLSPDYLSEPVGLASACLAAGARGVVAALWPVDDAVTLELMTHFYRGIAEGATVSSALRQARRYVSERHPHPYYWAAFRYIAAPPEEI